MALVKARVALTIIAGDAYRFINIGDMVDLDEPVGTQRLGNCVNPDHFEAPATAPSAPAAPAAKNVTSAKSADKSQE